LYRRLHDVSVNALQITVGLSLHRSIVIELAT